MANFADDATLICVLFNYSSDFSPNSNDFQLREDVFERFRLFTTLHLVNRLSFACIITYFMLHYINLTKTKADTCNKNIKKSQKKEW